MRLPGSRLLGFIAVCFLAAMTGALFRPGEWYERLKKPSRHPTNRLFAPVWTVLYLMIAVSGWLVWREAGFAGAPYMGQSSNRTGNLIDGASHNPLSLALYGTKARAM